MIIRNIEKGSPAASLEIREGDELLTLNGRPVRDRIDYRFHGAEEVLELAIRSLDGTERRLRIEKDPDEDLGLLFADETKIIECHNKCPFCFVDQSPPGVRRELDIRDDDYRLSFEHGHYVTLTNLKEEEFDRIVEQRLSPLYVSVHATDPEARRRLLIHKQAGRILELLDRLGAEGIRTHTQAVICPGWNDGAILDRTIEDLAARHPHVESLSVVPVGLTAHREGLPSIDPVTPAIAEELLSQTDRWRKLLLARLGTAFVFASDELYLHVGRDVPGAPYYEGFGQEENGVGMTRRFIQEFRKIRKRLRAGVERPRRLAWVTGTLAAPVIAREAIAALAGIEGLDARLVPVVNRFYGASVTCAGLLAGEDIARAFTGVDPEETVLLPGNCLNSKDLFVDSMPLAALAARLGRRVLVGRDGVAALLAEAGLT